VQTRLTGPYDTHPALYERLRALQGSDEPSGERDDRLAAALFSDADALEGWLGTATRDRVVQAFALDGRTVGTLRLLPWSSIPGQVYVPGARESARRLAERLHPMFPTVTTAGGMLASVWGALEAGKMGEIALRLNPGLGALSRLEGERAAVRLSGEVLSVLLQGALMEGGAVCEHVLGGFGLTFTLDQDRVAPVKLLSLLASDLSAARAALDGWAKRLGAAPNTSSLDAECRPAEGG
jgi:hypothetical protein